MSSGRRFRKRRPARRRATREPKRRLLVVCEGSVTEPSYLRGYEAWVRNATLELEIPSERGVPLTLVQIAKEKKAAAERAAKAAEDPFLAYDEVWCVFDIDEHPNLNDAYNLARSNGILLAVSNPCFELWLLLHFRESPGPQSRHRLQKMMRNFVSDYDKHIDFSRFADLVADATRRAKRLDDDAREEGEAGRNPTTGVYRLTDSIRRESSAQ